MPELPEVEVTRQSFAAAIAGARILAVRVGKPLRWPLGCDPQRLVGQKVLGVRRRAKYLLMDLNDGLLLWHLGMSGSLLFSSTPPPAQTHDHFDLVTDCGVLRLHDPRRFGAVVYATDQSSAEALGGGAVVHRGRPNVSTCRFHARIFPSRLAAATFSHQASVVVG
jgi:formamidopyrimidine-DNA glycosylase